MKPRMMKLDFKVSVFIALVLHALCWFVFNLQFLHPVVPVASAMEISLVALPAEEGKPELQPPSIKKIVAAVPPPEIVIPPKIVPVPTPAPVVKGESFAETPPPPIIANNITSPAPDLAESIDTAPTPEPAPFPTASPTLTPSSADRETLTVAIPKYRRNMEPEYPFEAKRRSQQGEVIVSVAVDIQGKVTGVKLAKSSGYSSLDKAALAAVRHWEFEPARLGKQAVEWEGEQPVNFKLSR